MLKDNYKGKYMTLKEYLENYIVENEEKNISDKRAKKCIFAVMKKLKKKGYLPPSLNGFGGKISIKDNFDTGERYITKIEHPYLCIYCGRKSESFDDIIKKEPFKIKLNIVPNITTSSFTSRWIPNGYDVFYKNKKIMHIKEEEITTFNPTIF